MKKVLFACLCSVLLLSCSQEKDIRVLVLYQNSGHHKAFTDATVSWLNKVAAAEQLQLTEILDPEPVNAAYLKDFDVVLQLDYPPYMWPEEAVQAFEQYLDEGHGGWVGLHHASLLGEFDGYAMWPWFSELLGGIRFQDYIAELSDGTVLTERPNHPVFQGLPDRFVIPDDEWYTYDKNPRLSPDVEVLASVDEGSYTRQTDKKMGDHPVVWTNTSKKGRNVYFQFGHSPRLADDPHFQTLLLNAIHWAAGKKEARRVVASYVTSWTEVMPNPAYLTHINYAFGHVSEHFDAVRIDNEARLKQIVALKESHPGLKVLLSIGGWGSGRFSEMAADEALRASFSKDCARLCRNLNLDGIDIDWEYPGKGEAAGISYSPDDKDHFTLLMRDIRKAIGAGKLLTLAGCCDPQYIDFQSVIPYVDFVNLMTYDMNEPEDSFHCALFPSEHTGAWTADVSVKAHLAAGVPADKLVVGVPFYGKGSARWKGGRAFRDLAAIPADYTECWDSLACGPYLTDAKGRFVFGYENERSLRNKCAYIREMGLRGIMNWEYAGDSDALELTRIMHSLVE